jgi:transposase InsO family protein
MVASTRFAREGLPEYLQRVFSTLEAELLAKHRFKAPGEAQLKGFRYIEGWYNPHRWHSALGQRSPLRCEQTYLTSTPVAA